MIRHVCVFLLVALFSLSGCVGDGEGGPLTEDLGRVHDALTEDVVGVSGALVAESAFRVTTPGCDAEAGSGVTVFPASSFEDRTPVVFFPNASVVGVGEGALAVAADEVVIDEGRIGGWDLLAVSYDGNGTTMATPLTRPVSENLDAQPPEPWRDRSVSEIWLQDASRSCLIHSSACTESNSALRISRCRR